MTKTTVAPTIPDALKDKNAAEIFRIMSCWSHTEKGPLLNPRIIAFAAAVRAKSAAKYEKDILGKLDGWQGKPQFHDKVLAYKPPNDPRRPSIVIDKADLPGMLEQAEKVLAEATEDGVYQSLGRLVQMYRHHNTDHEQGEDTEGPLDKGDEHTRRADNALLVGDIGPLPLQVLLATRAQWLVLNKDGDKKPAEPPLRYAQHLVAAHQWKRIPVLLGTTEAPTLRQNGTILQTPGYDRRGQLFFNTGGVTFPPVPGRPTKDDALAALALLKAPIALFPFVPDEDDPDQEKSASRSVALSAMLTAMVRRTLAGAPIHAFDAPQAGSGKTKLLSLPAVLATGRMPVMVAQGENDAEFNKRLFSVLRTGDLVIGFDNITRPIGTDELNLVLTARSWQSRVLGESRTETVATNALICFTGNNLEFVGDVTDRTLVCRIEPNVETPSERDFPFDPPDYVLANRAGLAVAALTILRAHMIAGLPGAQNMTPSRFPEWDRVVRGALIWLGESDPYRTHDDLRKVDSDRDEVAALHRAWKDAFGVGWPAKKGAKDVEEHMMGEQGDALSAALGHDASTKAIGKRLKKIVGRVIEGHALRSKPDAHTKVSVYWLEKVRPDGLWNDYGY